MRAEPSVMHLDLDAFFAAVEKRDKPSLASKPVIVGGTGGRGVVATASYEARAFGARSAMSTAEARRRCPPGTAFLGGRFAAYRKSSQVVMDVLREMSPLVEQVSIDEAYVDLAAGDGRNLSVEGVTSLGNEIRARIQEATGGLTASIGIASTKMLAKIGSDLNKPDGLTVVAPGQELAVLHPLPVGRLGGVGPATGERLAQMRVKTVGDLTRLTEVDLVSMFGKSHGRTLFHLARAEDDRPVVPDREAKSVSAEETFTHDLFDPARLGTVIDTLAARVGRRLQDSDTAGRTVVLKVRRSDFSTMTRSYTAPQPTDDVRQVAATARRLLMEAGVVGGVRLLGVGVSGLATYVQGDLFTPADEVITPVHDGIDVAGIDQTERPAAAVDEAATRSGVSEWFPGQDVAHDEHGAGWVWGRGRSLVTVRFEGPTTPPGPVRTFAVDDPALHPADPPDWH
jgi:DNA polymerase-4